MKITDWSEMPSYVIKEMEKIESKILPYTQKAAKYSFWSLPLILLSIFNLFFLLFILPDRNLPVLIVYGLIGAIGLAFSKEAKFYQREVLKRSIHCMIERIKDSDIVPNVTKEDYIRRIQQQSISSYYYFIEFLKEEHRMKYTYY
ncbi:DUF5392 family protein [Aquibacillus salsiterrae]|uniref:YwnF family protein n=1 Tax=Aquibacillus salsiterrae TaxID=2950439 RepID=A0A9X4AGF5_9BACI|nr:DUF5392 family protein [Aquibacillus salsiterrae]MDC3418629.1 YwnF family protein [Aquibacillus salsiterrae]